MKKGKKVRPPYCRNPILTTCKGFVLRIEGNELVLPQKVKVLLNDYVLNKARTDTELRSATINNRGISICYSKEVTDVNCEGVVGIDTNLENVTAAFDPKNIKRFDMHEIASVNQSYRELKSHFKRNDYRIMKRISSKYGKLQADKTQSEMHKITSKLVKLAKRQKLAICLENIKEIRKLYRKGNGQGRNYRARLNSWAFGEFQKQIEYRQRTKV